MGEQSMVTDIDTECAKDVDPQYQQNDPGPTEEPWNECEKRDKMDENDRTRISPFNPPTAAGGRARRANGIVNYTFIAHARPSP